jgi:C4-dicarboxylate-specific signal transduction histidine kinase
VERSLKNRDYLFDKLHKIIKERRIEIENTPLDQPLRHDKSTANTSRDINTVKRLFEQINDAAFRASEVFESFLSLFRGGRQEHQPVDINVLALEAVQLLRKELDDHNVIAHTMLAELPTIQGNRGQLREVILNLVQNSIEAMATIKKQRIISVATARHDSHSISISLQDHW